MIHPSGDWTLSRRVSLVTFPSFALCSPQPLLMLPALRALRLACVSVLYFGLLLSLSLCLLRLPLVSAQGDGSSSTVSLWSMCLTLNAPQYTPFFNPAPFLGQPSWYNFSHYTVALSTTLQAVPINVTDPSAVYLAINATGWRATSWIRYHNIGNETLPPSTYFENTTITAVLSPQCAVTASCAWLYNKTGPYLYPDNLFTPALSTPLSSNGLALNFGLQVPSTPYLIFSALYSAASNDLIYAFNNDSRFYTEVGFATFSAAVYNATQLQVRITPYNASSPLPCVLPLSTQVGQALGDPTFVGLRGQRFQVHGLHGAVYALITSPTSALNARFLFLDGPRACPVLPSTVRRPTACWSHAGSYLHELGAVVRQGDGSRSPQRIRIRVVAGSAAEGFALVAVDGVAVAVAVGAEGGHLVTRHSTHELTLHLPPFHVDVENIDGFVNLRAVSLFPNWQLPEAAEARPHGLLGQTWSSRQRAGSRFPHIEGDVDDYLLIADDTNDPTSDLFATAFLYSRFPEGPALAVS